MITSEMNVIRKCLRDDEMSQQGYVDKRCSSCYAGARRKQLFEFKVLYLKCFFRKMSQCAANAKRALVFLAPGAEEMEFVVAADVLRRGGTLPLPACRIRRSSSAAGGVNIQPDISVSDAKGPYDVLVLPGGLGGSKAMAESKAVGELLKQQEKAGKMIAAICAAPTALKAHGVALGKNVTSYPAMKPQMEEGGNYSYKEDNVVVDGNVITSRGPGTAFDFALTIVDKLAGKEKASEVAKAMLLSY
ncbi:hypothetical protein NQ318_015129 [Aromia moschata]|uniref:DJ-1/PfpI domain-containing protein n=1 Tax=Aromia moschata TaxID=1265417 RepID=A0AAV8YZ93_9CUCU|nr:hypothetical protein NQ318_015129 [Aromia moschata]